MIILDVIKTERLNLRTLRLDDAGLIFDRMAQDAEVTRFLSWSPHQSIDETISFLKERLAAQEKSNGYCFAITLKDDNSPIGMIMLRRHKPFATIGFLLAKPYWRNGYASEAVAAIVNWIFNDAEIYYLLAYCDEENISSIRVLEKCGFFFENLLRQESICPTINDKARDTYAYIRLKQPLAAIKLEPITLVGEYAQLSPLSFDHFEQLCETGLDEALWRWIPTQVRTREDMRNYLETALKEAALGLALPFAIIERATDRIVGSTRFANIERNDRRVEIGWTWVGRQWQRTPINTETKYLMLKYAFESLGCLRVELKTDALNQQSRNAILRLGAKEEGIFRNHRITSTGRVRHTVYFSIIASEWLKVKSNLQEKLACPFIGKK